MSPKNLLFITGTDDSKAIASRMEHSSNNDMSLTELCFSEVHVDKVIIATVENILLLSKQDDGRCWEGFHLRQCTGMIPEILQVACQRVPKLSITLKDSNNTRGMDASWCSALSRGLQNTSLKKLMLRGVPLSNDLAAALRENMRHLEEFELQISADTNTTSVNLLAGALQNCQSLQTFKAHHHHAGTMDECQQNMKTLMSALGNHKSLTDLSIQGSSCGEAGIRIIADCLLSKLEKLDLSDPRCRGDWLLGTDYLATRLLLEESPLKFLSLAGHRLEEQEVTLLADALANKSCQLLELCLTNCSISNESITSFATKVPQMQSLKRLWLFDNPFDVVGATRLLRAMKTNYILEQLVVPRSRRAPMKDIQSKIEYFLLLNRAGRRLLGNCGTHGCCVLPLFIWPKVLSRVTELKRDGQVGLLDASAGGQPQDAIFCLLQGPALLQRSKRSEPVTCS